MYYTWAECIPCGWVVEMRDVPGPTPFPATRTTQSKAVADLDTCRQKLTFTGTTTRYVVNPNAHLAYTLVISGEKREWVLREKTRFLLLWLSSVSLNRNCDSGTWYRTYIQVTCLPEDTNYRWHFLMGRTVRHQATCPPFLSDRSELTESVRIVSHRVYVASPLQRKDEGWSLLWGCGFPVENARGWSSMLNVARAPMLVDKRFATLTKHCLVFVNVPSNVNDLRIRLEALLNPVGFIPVLGNLRY
jgi:hypothetical protein